MEISTFLKFQNDNAEQAMNFYAATFNGMEKKNPVQPKRNL
ncbi:hypothetical protein SAMN05660903_01978 [Salegentibacter salinarum]|nr:VOC family protein [Salegentibacter salinarum]SKB67669.1 hypothetical protein SAMN05660903_01978 [Salegentibacter salinarum]